MNLKSGARVQVSKLKKDPLDFVLWKPSEDSDPGWNLHGEGEDQDGI